MAEGVLINIAKSVLEQLSSPALKEFLRLRNFKKELKKLEDTVETISNVLQDAEQRQFKEHLVQGWLDKLRVVMYDADDLFDSVAARALRRKAMTGSAFKKEVRLFFSKSNQLAFIFKTAHEVKAIRKRLDDIAKNMSQFNFITKGQSEEKTVRLHEREETHSFVRAKDVIGRDKEKEEIIELLLREDHRGEGTNHQDLSVVAIIGFGGLGKTTLAQLVYNDERVQRGFDLCLWTCINYFTSLKEVLMAIKPSAVKLKPHDLNLDQLQEEIRKYIEGKKYFIVLDDVWDDNALHWRKLKPFLDCGRSGSKVLVTTRNIKVAQCLDASEPYYQLNVLLEESAWSLFVKIAFKEGELGKDPELEKLGKDIVRKCGYVPLALITIGSMLRYKEKERKVWSNFLGECTEVISNNDDGKIMEALKFSYNDLPTPLKHCFAYCSLFPKDYIFDKDKLVLLWQAQGFVKPFATKQSLEEVGDAYFLYLVDRCFFQEVKQSTSHGCHKYTFKMHDLLHDLAQEVAGKESKCFIDEGPSSMVENRTLRHISVIDTAMDFPLNFSSRLSHSSEMGSSFNYSSLLSYSRTLRTLLCRAGVNKVSLNMILGRFRMLRTLDLRYLDIETLPDSIGELIHLRYLDLSGSNLKFLPNSVCKLYHLQTIRLETCDLLMELPSDIGKLASLRHLFLMRCHNLFSLPPGLAALTSLVTLDFLFVHPYYGGLRYLDQLDNLCGTMMVMLPTEGWSNAVDDARKSNMSRKQRLNGMILDWEEYTNSGALEMDKDEVKAAIEALEPHANLQYLKFSYYGGNTLPSWVFSLQNVKELHLQDSNLEYLDDRIRCHPLLPSLEILKVKRMPNLKGWWRQVMVGDDLQRLSLPCLSRVSKIVIKECPELTESMPLFGGTEKMELEEVNEELVRELLTGNMKCSSSSPSEFHYRLKGLRLVSINELTRLPEDWISHLTALQNLEIVGCHELSWVSSGGLARLTALQELRLLDKLVVRDDEHRWTGIGMPWKALQNLRALLLRIGDKNFQNGLRYLTALEELRIVTWEVQEAEVAVNDDEESTEGDGESPWKGLQRLRRMDIGFGGKTFRFPKGIQYFRSLEELCVRNCKELSLSWTSINNQKLYYLVFNRVENVVNVDKMVEEEQTPFTSLVRLEIYDSEAKWIYDYIPWKLISSIYSLSIKKVSKLRSVPDGIQHLNSLHQLEIENCEKIRAMPNWMVNLSSLKQLSLVRCSPELKKRCEEPSGEDWHLISHIPDITITEAQHPESHEENETSSDEVGLPL